MKTIGFIGGFEKTDLIINIAKILVEFRQKVLMIDGTVTGRARYIVPSISPGQAYITEYQGIDIAVGFKTLDEIGQYLKTSTLPYDIILTDVDSYAKFERFYVEKTDKKFFVTAFDSYSLKRGLEIMGKRENKIEATKVLFTKRMSKAEEDYLNFLSANYSVKWDKDKIYFPYSSEDMDAIMENQRVSKITLKNLSIEYKEGIFQIVQQILTDAKHSDIKKIIKNI